MLTEGLATLEMYRKLAREYAQLEADFPSITQKFHGWEPVIAKSEICKSLDRLQELRLLLGATAAKVECLLDRAMIDPKEHSAAREALTDYCWERIIQAENSGNIELFAYYEEQFRHYDNEKYTRQIDEAGSLSLSSSPSGAVVYLAKFHEAGFILELGESSYLGKTPLSQISLPMGSYLAILRKEGYKDVSYPIFISRGFKWQGAVNLFTEEDVGDGFIHIPAGPFIAGGDPETRGWALPASKPWIDDYFLAQHPVLSWEYLEFINDLAPVDRDQAVRRAPRVYPESGCYLIETDDGTFALPPPGNDGQKWGPSTPVLAVSWHDAMAYCKWRSQREGCSFRLPTEFEWEKAARGVDGRWYPWGNRFDASLCNMRDSRPLGPGPVSIDDFPTDCSVYGVRGLAGNVRDWTSTCVGDTLGTDAMLKDIAYRKQHPARDAMVIRGGAWSPILPRLADRYWISPELVLSFLGFRLAKSAPERSSP